MKKSVVLMAIGAALMANGLAAKETESQDVKMINLAHQSGCVTCHSIASGGSGPAGLKPIGPAWQDVAKKYSDVEYAQEALVTTVLNG